MNQVENIRPPHEAIVADEHWLGVPLQHPEVPLLSRLKDEYGSRNSISLTAGLGNFCLSLDHGCSAMEVPEGAQLPIMDGHSLLKVVRDIRQERGRLSLFAGAGTIDPEVFDERAREMLSEKIYRGNPATLEVPTDPDGNKATVSRVVEYYWPSPSGRQLSGIPSYLVKLGMKLGINLILPPYVVGEVYKSGRNQTTQVIAAEILKPHRGHKENKAQFAARRLLPRFDLEPSPVPA